MVPLQKCGLKVEIEMFLPWFLPANSQEEKQFTPKEIAIYLFENISQYYSFETEKGKRGKFNFKAIIHPENVIDFLTTLKEFEKTYKNSIEISLDSVFN
jgi:hypothetical protein